MSHFMDRLAQSIKTRGNPVFVGLDPRHASLPPSIRPADGAGTDQIADAYVTFCQDVLDVVAPLVPGVKLQAAFFEELGVPGIQALAQVIADAKARGLIVILDAKRGDIGSTAEAYARGLLGSPATGPDTQPAAPVSLAADALTINPYLGGDSIQPFVDRANEQDCGLFVLVKTSNPDGGRFQDLVADGQPVYAHVAAYVEELARATLGQRGYGAIGAVVGATYPEQLARLRTAMPQTWFLVPGYGSQGGTAADVASAFDGRGLGAIVNNSRGIIFAYRKPEFTERFGSARWQDAVDAATREMIAELRAETPAGKLAL